MKAYPFYLPAVAAALLLLGGTARAEMVGFSYQWSVLPTSVFPGGTGSVTLAAASDGSSSAELGSSTPTFIPGATVTTTSSATDPADTFNTPFSMKLHLTDTGSGLFGDLNFSGTIAGTLTATTSTLTATFDDPFIKTLELGSRVFTVQIDPSLVSLPVPGGQSSPASIDARVTVANKVVDEPPPTHHTPEPSSLLLAGLGLPLLAAARRWRRTRAAPQA